MKKSIYTLGLLLLVSFALTGCGTKNSTTTGTQTDTTGSSQGQNFKGSLLDMIKLGKSVKCTYSTSGEDGSTTGETYVSGTKARTDFTLTSKDGTKTDSHSVMDGEWVYIWTSATEQGTKMKISDMQKSADSSAANTSTAPENKNLTQSVDYKCSPWVPDDSKFAAPSNITFTDLTDMINQLKNPSGNSNSMCGACSLAGSADKVAECKKSLGCN